MNGVTIGEIADFLQGSFEGDRNRVIRGVRPLSDATAEDLTFLANPKYAKQVATSAAGAILVDRKLEGNGPSWIRVDDPYLALARVLQRWFYKLPLPEGISPDAHIANSAQVDSSARIAAGVTIGENVTIGKDVAIFAGCVIGDGSRIGDESLLYPNVTLYHGTSVGRRCILHAGVVVGSDGFGFVTAGGKHHKIPQIGIVRIEDDVEIGANTTIDRAALGETVIGEGTKIDNLVQIAHNVKIGRNCILVSQVGIAGSSELGDYVVIGGQAGVSGHLKIGSQVMIAAKAAVMKGFDKPGQIAGTPARPLRDHLKTEAMIRRLPKVIERLKRVESKLGLAQDEQDKE